MEPARQKEGGKTSENLEEVSRRGAQTSQHHLECGKKNSRKQSPMAQYSVRPLFHEEPNGLTTNYYQNSRSISVWKICVCFCARFKQVLVNFRSKSFFVTTLVQSKQICSFDRRRRNTHILVDRSGTDSFRHLIQGLPNVISDTSCKMSPATPHFLARNPNKNPSSETSRPLTTLSLARPLRGLKYSTLKFMRSICGKSNRKPHRILTKMKCNFSLVLGYLNRAFKDPAHGARFSKALEMFGA